MLRLQRQPDISFLTPTYKLEHRKKSLKQCIESVRQQTALTWEHWICTQHYHEATEKFVEGFRDPRIKYTFTARKGKSGNNQRCHMVQNAKGLWFHFLDDDNLLYKNFSNVLGKEIENTDKGLIIIRILHSYFRMRPFPTDRTWGRPQTLRYNGVDALNIVVRADVARNVGWRDTGSVGGDGDFAKRVVKKIGGKKVKYIKQVLAEHRNIYGKRGARHNRKKKSPPSR
jgi:hypothetical protein